MKTCNQLQTMAVAYAEICQGEDPWIALGNFMNDWFDYAKDRREQLVTGMSISDTPRCSKSHTNCSKYDTPVDISSAKLFTGTISMPQSMTPILAKIVIFAHTL